MRHSRRPPAFLLGVTLLTACVARRPQVAGSVPDLDRFLAAHRLSRGEEFRADEIGRTATASYHVVQVVRGEEPHRHLTHDLTLVVLRGRGVLVIGNERFAVRAGDAAVIPRATPHAFVNDGRSATITMAVFSPPLDGPDRAPAFDSPGIDR